MTWVAVDPGKNGAVGILFDDGSVKTIRAPKVKGEKGLNELDEAAYAAIGKMISDLKCPVAIEDVHAFPGQGVVSMFGMGGALYLWRGVFAAHGVKPIKIRPQEWRKSYWEPGSLDKTQRKKASIIKANELFPRLEIKHDGEAEALLMALHLKKTLGASHG